jgi:hypothetical protein
MVRLSWDRRRHVTGDISRRDLLKLGVAILPVGGIEPAALFSERVIDGGGPEMVSDAFPAQPVELVREMVTVAHFDLKRVKELADTRPSLVKAAWDWGFGDWETPLGAASHMGNRAIADYLLEKGAMPTIFSAAMLGQLDVVKTALSTGNGVQKIRGPHSISLLAHARMGGETARPVLEYLQGLEGADSTAPVSLTESETAALVGTYVFGVGVTQQIEVDANLKMYLGGKMYTYAPQLNWTRKGTMPRPLFHLGGKVFWPAGAETVRVRFADSAGSIEIIVADGELEMRAARK